MQDRFCGNCGVAIISNRSVRSNMPSLTLPKLALSKKTAKRIWICIGVVAATLIAYGGAHFTYGPATPAQLEKEAIAALTNGDINKLVTWLDPSQSDMKQPALLEAFQQSLSDPTKKMYETAFHNASISAAASSNPAKMDSKALNSNRLQTAESNRTIEFVRTSNWRGTRWNFKVKSAGLELKVDPKLTLTAAIGSPQGAGGTFQALWPSTYKYQAQVSNAYASETLSGTADVGSTKKTLDLTRELQTRMTIRLPQLKDLTATLNGTVLTNSPQDIVISPAPKEAKLGLKGTYLGKSIDETVPIALDSIKGTITLTDTLNRAVSKWTIEPVYTAILSAVEAYNGGDISLLKATKPDTVYSKSVSTGKPADNRTKLVKVAIDPASIKVKDNEFTIDAGASFVRDKNTGFFSDNRNYTEQWTYTLQKQPDKEEWWIVARSSNFFGGNPLTNPQSIVKTNPIAPASTPANL